MKTDPQFRTDQAAMASNSQLDGAQQAPNATFAIENEPVRLRDHAKRLSRLAVQKQNGSHLAIAWLLVR